jgi:PAS domain S-box-containing protein
MPKKPKLPETSADHRRRADLDSLKSKSKPTAAPAEIDSQRLLPELEVHQIELERQNAELRRAHEAADSAREKYTDLYDFAPVGFFTLTADTHIQMANLTGAALLGTDRARLLGKSFVTHISQLKRDEFTRVLNQVFDEGNEQSLDVTLLRKSHPPTVATLTFKRSPDGRECNLAALDISQRRRQEQALLISEIRFRRLFETAHDGVLLLDPKTRQITEANPFMLNLLGYTYEQLIGKELYEIGLLKDRSKSRDMVTKLKKTHEVRYENLPLKARSGKQQAVEVVANLYQENGRPVIQCNIRDITARKIAEDILRRSEALFSSLIGQAPVGVYVVDSHFRLLQVNPTALPVFGNEQPLIGRDLAELLILIWPKRIANQVMTHFKNTLLTGESYQSPHFTERRRDVGIKEHYDWQLQRLILPNGELCVVCFFNNITERIKAESTQRRLDVMAASNLKLKREIVHRQKIEEKLHETEYVQSRLLEHSLQQQSELRNLSHQIIHIQEDERKRISRELHDTITQTLVGINVHVAALANEATDELSSLQQRLAHTHQMVESSVEIIHKFARDLRPTVLDDLGLIPALQDYLKRYTASTGVRAALKISSSIEQSPDNIRTVFYRIVQEALANVAKHSQASQVEINIRRNAASTSLQISDDGQGFAVDEKTLTSKANRLGLLGMKERAEMVGGVFTVESALGSSTTLRVIIKNKPKKPSK